MVERLGSSATAHISLLPLWLNHFSFLANEWMAINRWKWRSADLMPLSWLYGVWEDLHQDSAGGCGAGWRRVMVVVKTDHFPSNINKQKAKWTTFCLLKVSDRKHQPRFHLPTTPFSFFNFFQETPALFLLFLLIAHQNHRLLQHSSEQFG